MSHFSERVFKPLSAYFLERERCIRHWLMSLVVYRLFLAAGNLRYSLIRLAVKLKTLLEAFRSC